MVTLDARDVGAPPDDRSTRNYRADDQPWAAELLERTVGRDRFRRGALIDVSNLPGIVATRGVERIGVATTLNQRDEIEIAAVAAEPGDEATIGLLLSAVVASREAAHRRVSIVCYNAELGLQRLVQQSGFTLCAVRPGVVERARTSGPRRLPNAINGVPVRDEVEFDLLLR